MNISYVYILKEFNEDRVKIGKANNILARINQLSHYNFDIENSFYIETSTEADALRIEQNLHKAFKKYNVIMEKADGSTEFFDSSILEIMLTAVSFMPSVKLKKSINITTSLENKLEINSIGYTNVNNMRITDIFDISVDMECETCKHKQNVTKAGYSRKSVKCSKCTEKFVINYLKDNYITYKIMSDETRVNSKCIELNNPKIPYPFKTNSKPIPINKVDSYRLEQEIKILVEKENKYR